jgi:small subunit ribosomal protein S6
MADKRIYEVAFLVKEGDIAKAVVERIKGYITRAKGAFSAETDMGTRSLAYTIFKNREKFNRAFYYFVKAEFETTQVPEFTRLIKLDEDIIRHLVLVEK